MSFFTGILYILLAFGGVAAAISTLVLLFAVDLSEKTKKNRKSIICAMWLGLFFTGCLFCQCLTQDHIDFAKTILKDPKAFVIELAEEKIKGKDPTPAQVLVKIDDKLTFLKNLTEQKDANSALYREALDALLKERLALIQELNNDAFPLPSEKTKRK